ncbi:MAG: hypothetical protein KY476_11260 [Planctomycetes bacterium]|nr:hypothetical protein [Planctomycetota bacterium]
MSTRYVKTPTSRCRLGVARGDVTPPVGVYHRFWGAASHDRATGVHRPLTATVLAFSGLDECDAEPFVLVAIDHCLLRPREMDALLAETARRAGTKAEHITFAFSHTHSGGNLCRDRSDLPGGELIGPYLDELPATIAAAIARAIEQVSPATATYGTANCAMAADRDYFDEDLDRYVCGFNPDGAAGFPVKVVRFTGESGGLIATVVNYPCHATTLAWENTLISPDYIGALRETVERETSAPCVFLPAPCGDVGPVVGFVGDVETAERNGRQAGFAALGAFEALPPPAHDFHYAGAVLSGATLGTWQHRPLSAKRSAAAATFRHEDVTIPLPLRDDLPTVVEAEAELSRLLAEEASARSGGDLEAAVRLRALAERSRRLLERIRPLPTGSAYPYAVRLVRLGDAVWVFVEGEPYFALQLELERRHPDVPLIVVPLANGARCSYLPPRECYGRPLYQAEVALLAAGCLEQAIEVTSAHIGSLR